jgi:predicted RNase H-like HicB family nuclease
MYDIKIFLEDNGEFWARVNAWKEIVYWVWKNQDELMQNIKQWLELSFENKKRNQNVSKLFSYFNESNKNTICH